MAADWLQDRNILVEWSGGGELLIPGRPRSREKEEMGRESPLVITAPQTTSSEQASCSTRTPIHSPITFQSPVSKCIRVWSGGHLDLNLQAGLREHFEFQR